MTTILWPTFALAFLIFAVWIQIPFRRLAFIKHARDLGFPVEAVRSLLDLADQPDRSCADADRLAAEHLAEVERKIAQLQALRDELARVTAECSHGRVAECRVIEVLSDHALCLTDQHR